MTETPKLLLSYGPTGITYRGTLDKMLEPDDMRMVSWWRLGKEFVDEELFTITVHTLTDGFYGVSVNDFILRVYTPRDFGELMVRIGSLIGEQDSGEINDDEEDDEEGDEEDDEEGDEEGDEEDDEEGDEEGDEEDQTSSL